MKTCQTAHGCPANPSFVGDTHRQKKESRMGCVAHKSAIAVCFSAFTGIDAEELFHPGQKWTLLQDDVSCIVKATKTFPILAYY